MDQTITLYDETYLSFIEKIKHYERDLSNCYTEKHHIIPKCMNGSDSEENLIQLLPQEHFIAHKLLALENPNNEKLVYAFSMMAYSKSHNQQRYECTAEEYAIVKQLISNSRKGVSHPGTTNGRKSMTDGVINKMVKPEEFDYYSSIGYYFGKSVTVNVSDETKAKLSAARKGKRFTDKHRANMSTAFKGKHVVVKDGEMKRVTSDELQTYLENGWIKGTLNTPSKNKICVNDGKVNKFIKKEELDNYLANGYVSGMLKIKH